MTNFKRGDIRSDGFVFERYKMENGILREKWRSPAAIERDRISKARYYQENKESRRVAMRKWDASNKDWHKSYYAKRRKSHASEIKATFEKWRAANLDHYRNRTSAWARRKRESDPLFKLIQSSRCRVRQALKNKKTKRTMDYIGCSSIELSSHLESQFKDGMTWENHTKTGWHVDHIVPLASAKTEAELIQLLHYTNLRPLWAKDNLSKGRKTSPPPPA